MSLGEPRPLHDPHLFDFHSTGSEMYRVMIQQRDYVINYFYCFMEKYCATELKFLEQYEPRVAKWLNEEFYKIEILGGG